MKVIIALGHNGYYCVLDRPARDKDNEKLINVLEQDEDNQFYEFDSNTLPGVYEADVNLTEYYKAHSFLSFTNLKLLYKHDNIILYNP